MTTGVLVLLGVLVASTLAGVVYQRRNGRLRDVGAPADSASAHADAVERLDPALLADLGVVLGERATLVQFSTAFCQPCRATRRILGDVAAAVPGVRHVEVDAESHLDAVRALEILRTPTTLVLDPTGAVRQRAAGQPRKEQVLAAVAALS